MKDDLYKWERRYTSEAGRMPDPDPWLVANAGLLDRGRCLDLACGRGANALFAAECGYHVDAVDISLAVLRALKSEARSRAADVACVAADLDYFPLPKSVYDLVLVFFFFSEPLIPAIKTALKPGALLWYATYNERHTSVKPGFNPAYLIKPGALADYFSDFDIILNEPAAGSAGNVSRLVARGPNS